MTVFAFDDIDVNVVLVFYCSAVAVVGCRIGLVGALDRGFATSDAISLGIYFVNTKRHSVEVTVLAFAFRLVGLAPNNIGG